MPLKQGSSEKTIGENVATERNTGRPEKQAVAIAENEARRSRDNAPLVTGAGAGLPLATGSRAVEGWKGRVL